MEEVKIEELQRVGQKKFIREGWAGRLVLHEKNGGQLSASGDHKKLFEGLNPETETGSYDRIKFPSKEITTEVFRWLRDPDFLQDGLFSFRDMLIT